MRFHLELALCIGFLSNAFAHDPQQWEPVPVVSYRYVNTIQMADNQTIILAGGWEANDAIRTIWRSTDRGTTWHIIADLPDSSWIKSVGFVNPLTGFTVGYDGTITKTTDGGQTWTRVPSPANTASRNFNSLFFVNAYTGFIAGGSRTNDSLQTILKTTDGGDSWTVKRDALGYRLKAIFFTDENNGFAVGDHGTLLKSTDGGNNWTPLTLPGNTSQRDFNTVFFLDANTGLIAGGNKTNDSIQTILKTTDGGLNWNIISDNLGPWITSIHFPQQYPDLTTGFAVGDKGTVLITEDAGDSWNPVAIPSSINDTLGLRAVYFLNLDFGIAAGAYGKILLYKDSTGTAPLVTTTYATNISPATATLQGTVNANGSPSKVTFEYGTLSSYLENSIDATPAVATGNSSTPVSIALTGLSNNTLHYFRIKAVNSSGTSYGEVKQFYTGDNPIPNWDFEEWDTITAFVPQVWESAGGISQVASYNSSHAVALQGGKKFSAVFIGHFGSPFYGGIPFAARPDSLVGYFNYSTSLNDSALLVLFFKKNGIFNSQNIFHITGNSHGVFERLSFPITYTDSNIPDTAMIGFLNTDPFFNIPDSSNYLAVDDISFSGTNVNVPNYDFEEWEIDSVERLNSWHTSDGDDAIIFSSTITKTYDSSHGNFAARMQSIANNENDGSVIMAGEDHLKPAFPVYARYSNFNGYLKCFPENSDTLTITVNMFYNGTLIGSGALFLDTAVSIYTPFNIPIDYFGTVIIPDSANIFISTSKMGNVPRGNSVLYIDNLSFDGFYSSAHDVAASPVNDFSWTIFPNPAQNHVTLHCESPVGAIGTITFSIIDLNGKTVRKTIGDAAADHDTFTMKLEDIENGYYLVALQRGYTRQFKKLIVIK